MLRGAVGSIFSNVQIGDLCGFSQAACSKGFGFGTGLQINTASKRVYISDFYKMYLRGNATNLNFPYTGNNTTNENINFFGGVLSTGYNQTPVQTCATLSNFEIHFYGVSFDGCPITIAGGGNTLITFDSDHFEATAGGSFPFVVVGNTSADVCPLPAFCHVTFVASNFQLDGTTPSSLINIAASGLYTFIAPKALAPASGVNAFVTSSSNNAYVLVENPDFQNITYTIDPSSGTHYGAANDIEHGAFITGTQNCAFHYGLGTITGCQSFAALSASQTWTFPNATGTVGVSGNGVTGFYQSVKNTPGCTTGSSLGNGCATGSGVVAVTWPTAFADSNYSVTCTGTGTLTGTPGPVYVVASTKLAASIKFDYLNLGATAVAAAYTSVDCIAVHD